MNDLFSEDPEFRRVQWTKLSDNVKDWSQEIGAMVAEKLPRNLGLDVTVVFQKTDDEKGYAIGTAVVQDQSAQNSIGIPIIVKAWNVAPFDVFFKEGKVFPLSDDNLAKVFFQEGLGAGVASQKPPPNLADDQQAESRIPPLGGKYSYASSLSMLDLLSGTLDASHLEELKTALHDDPGMLGAFHKHGSFDLLCKWAAAKPSSGDDKDNKERSLAAMTVKKDAPDRYRVWATSDDVFEPILVNADRRHLRSLLDMRRATFSTYEKDPLDSLDHYGTVTLVPPEGPYGKPIDGPKGSGVDGSGSYGAELGPHRNPWVFDPLQDDRKIENVTKFGRYAVIDKGGVTARGWVIPNVVDFDGKVVGTKLFLGKALAAVQGRIAGIPLNDDQSVTMDPDRPETGKVGVFVYRDGDRVLATRPFQVTGVTIYKRTKALSVVDFNGTAANLILSPEMDGIVPVTDRNSKTLGPLMGPKKNYMISAKMFFVKMPRITQVSEGEDDFKKFAVASLDAAPLKISVNSGRYRFRAPQLAKYAEKSDLVQYMETPRTAGRAAQAAHGAVEGPTAKQMAAKESNKASKKISKVAFDYGALERHEAEFLLGAWGLGAEKTAEVLDKAKDRIFLEVHALRWPATTRTKVASPHTKVARQLRAPIKAIVKCAAALDDAQTVDTVLSLGFVNPENISRFAAARPMLEEVSSLLAKLLIASRLGVNDIPEECVRSALMHLQRITEGLGKLKMLESNQQKTAAA